MSGWSRNVGWAAISVAVVCGVGLAALVGITALDKQTGFLPKLALFLVGILALVAALVATDRAAVDRRRRLAWLQPRPVAAVFLAIFFAFGVVTDVLPLFEPRPAVERRPHAIEDGVSNLTNQVETLTANAAAAREAPPRILREIAGLWGEPGCAVVFRFEIRGNSLQVTGVRQPPGTPPYRESGTILKAEGDVLTTVSQSEGDSGGRAAEFTYWTDGGTERLTWRDRPQSTPTEYRPCAG